MKFLSWVVAEVAGYDVKYEINLSLRDYVAPQPGIASSSAGKVPAQQWCLQASQSLCLSSGNIPSSTAQLSIPGTSLWSHNNCLAFSRENPLFGSAWVKQSTENQDGVVKPHLSPPPQNLCGAQTFLSHIDSISHYRNVIKATKVCFKTRGLSQRGKTEN